MNNKTTFIVGAGASVDYEFPTGYALIDKISLVCKLLDSFFSNHSSNQNNDSVIFLKSSEPVDALGLYIVGDLQISKDEAQRAVRKIGQTIWLSKSIDNYLNEQSDPTIKQIGKLLIFHLILKAEENSPLKGNADDLKFGEIRETWLMHFFRELRGSETDLTHVIWKMQNIKIINFNYDRTIEQFLIQAFSIYDNMSLTKAQEFIENNLNIVHVYGDLGKIDVATTVANFDGNVPFGISSKSIPGVLQNYTRIKLFTERQELNNQEIKVARGWIANSTKLVFLGFGFHPQNLKILKLLDHIAPLESQPAPVQRKTFATGMGLSNIRTETILSELNKFAGVYPKSSPDRWIKEHNPIVEDCTCPELFEKYGEQFFSQ